jgi:hypothetical protein
MGSFKKFLIEEGIYHTMINAHVDFAYVRIRNGFALTEEIARRGNTRFNEPDKSRAIAYKYAVDRCNAPDRAEGLINSFGWAIAGFMKLSPEKYPWEHLGLRYREWLASQIS